MSALMASVAASVGASDAPALGELLQAGVYSNIYSSDPANRSFNIAGVVHRAPGEGPFGGMCIYFPGDRESGIVDPSMGTGYLDFGTGDFTVECWFKVGPAREGAVCTLVSQWSTNSTYRSWTVEYTGAEVRFRFRTSASSTTRTVSFSIGNIETFEAAGWHHVAAQRRGTVCEIYVDGVKGGTTYTIGTTGMQQTNLYYPPCYGCAWSASGGNEVPSDSARGIYMDLVRITKGTARYTANFTRPSAPYPTGASDPLWTQVMWHFTHSGSWGYDMSTDAIVQLPVYPGGGVASMLQVAYSGAATYVGHIGNTGLAGRAGDTAEFATPDTSYDIGSQDFTFDIVCRRRTLDAAANTPGFGFVQNTGTELFCFGSGSIVSTFRFSWRASVGDAVSSFDFTGIDTSVDTALCVTREGNTMRFYRDGTKVGETTFTGAIKSFYSLGYKFMLNSAASGLNAKASRIIRGNAKYTGATRTIPTIEDLRSL